MADDKPTLPPPSHLSRWRVAGTTGAAATIAPPVYPVGGSAWECGVPGSEDAVATRTHSPWDAVVLWSRQHGMQWVEVVAPGEATRAELTRKLHALLDGSAAEALLASAAALVRSLPRCADGATPCAHPALWRRKERILCDFHKRSQASAEGWEELKRASEIRAMIRAMRAFDPVP
jgi:hypothetical protein